MANQEEKPLVSIVMITYNHEKFIAEAIEGVMMQETNFRYQLIIGEDVSKDNTRKICLEYKAKYPDKIKLVLREKNVGYNGNPNLIETYQNAAGSKYVALCEGDDYWTSPHKLQKQVDFLENNPDFAICFCNSQVVYFEGNAPSYYLNENIEKEVFTIEDLIGEDEIWFMATASVMYRKSALPELPDWFHKTLSGDIPMHILAARHGKIKYLPEPMTVYRKNLGGTSFTDNTKDERFLRNRIYMYSNLNQDTGKKFNRTMKKNIARYYLYLLECRQFEGKNFKKGLYALKYLEMARPDSETTKTILKKYVVPDFLLKMFRMTKKVIPV